MALPILYSFRRCPYAMRARLSLAHANIDYQLREVDLKNKPAEMLALSPKGTVPVLYFSDGKILEESLDIVDWALDQGDRSAEAVQAKAVELISECDQPFKKHLNGYKYPEREIDGLTHVQHRSAAALFLKKLEAQLGEGAYLFEDRVSKADFALFPFVRQFSGVDEDWFQAAPYPKLQAWLDRLQSGPLFDRVMAKHDPWQPLQINQLS